MNQAVTNEGFLLRPRDRMDTDISALRALAQAAVNVELFTIPLYMVAMYSIQGMHQITGKNEDFYQGRQWPGLATTADPQNPQEKAFNIIFSVVIEEMLHLQLAANIASCVGAKPTFTSSMLQNEYHGWICYGPDKSVIPHIVDLRDTKDWSNVKVNIGAVSPDQMLLFRAIEEPEEVAKKNIKKSEARKYFPPVPFAGWTPDKTEKDLPMFGTIGYLYKCYLDYLSMRYDDDQSKTLWDRVYNSSAVQRDLFNDIQPPGHPEREYRGFDTTITECSLLQVRNMMNAITDQGEGSELPQPQPRTTLAKVKEKYQASRAALEANYPSYSDTGKPVKSADASARFLYGRGDHYERFAELEGLLGSGMQTWPEWRTGQTRPWKAADLITKSGEGNKYNLPAPDKIAEAMNNLGSEQMRDAMYDKVSRAAVGSIAGITTVLNQYWTDKNVLFPYPAMSGSGDRMAICWALFRKAPDLSGAQSTDGHGTNGGDTLQHACQGLDLANRGDSNSCASVDVFHSCRGSNACKAQGGCGFVQKSSGGGVCGFALVKAKTDDGKTQPNQNTLYSTPSDNQCGTFGGCAAPISASQIFPKGGTMELFNFVDPGNKPQHLETMTFECGEKVHDVAYRAYQMVMRKRETPAPPKPQPNDLRLAFPPST